MSLDFMQFLSRAAQHRHLNWLRSIRTPRHSADAMLPCCRSGLREGRNIPFKTSLTARRTSDSRVRRKEVLASSRIHGYPSCRPSCTALSFRTERRKAQEPNPHCEQCVTTDVAQIACRQSADGRFEETGIELSISASECLARSRTEHDKRISNDLRIRG
jgi:hypothetical protein